jgi:hypothetical protein
MSSLQIQEYNQSVRNVTEAQRIFRDLGVQLLAIGESEPAVRKMMVFFGLDIDRAGEKLIGLSEIYAKATTDSKELRREIATAVLDIRSALAVSRNRSRNNLMKVQVEPMNLFRAGSVRHRIKSEADTPNDDRVQVGRLVRQRSNHRHPKGQRNLRFSEPAILTTGKSRKPTPRTGWDRPRLKMRHKIDRSDVMEHSPRTRKQPALDSLLRRYWSCKPKIGNSILSTGTTGLAETAYNLAAIHGDPCKLLGNGDQVRQTTAKHKDCDLQGDGPCAHVPAAKRKDHEL